MNKEIALAKLREVMRRKHLALSTEESYAGWLVRYIAYLTKRPGTDRSEQKLERFLTMLAREEVSASTQNQAFNALVFFYQQVLGQKLENINALRAKRATTERRSHPQADVKRLLEALQDESGYPTRLAVRLMYGCGLRVSEPVALRIRDVELANSRLLIRQAKGGKDRIVPLPCSLTHKSLETTMGYLHAEALSVRSPPDV